MKRSLWIGLGVAFVAVIGFWWTKTHTSGATPRYRTAAVERGSIESIVSATGTVNPVEQVEVGSQVSGVVAKLYADYNSRVTAGQVLCQLDPSSFHARELQSEAGVAHADAALTDAKRQLTRANELMKQNYVAQTDVEAAEVAVAQREADLKQARAQLEAAQVDLNNTTIRAPINGVVISRSIDLGQTVAASLQAPKLFVIANDLSQMQVETRIDEADIGRIQPDLSVSFTVDAFPDLTFEGRVAQVRLEPIVDQGVVTYTTVIRTANPELKLRPGMTANVSVLVAQHDDVLKVPNAALRFHPANEGKKLNHGETSGTGDARAASASPASTPTASAPPVGTLTASAAVTRNGRSHGTSSGAGGASAARGRRWAARGPAASAQRSDSAATSGPRGSADALKPGAIYVLRAGKPVKIRVATGLTDGASVEVQSDELQPGDQVIVGLELATASTNLQPPPGMGGPQFGGPRGGRPGGGGR